MHRYIRLTGRPSSGSTHSSHPIRSQTINSIKSNTIRSFTFTTLIIATFFCSSFTHAKPFKSHRCLDWRFGGWSPMLYSLQPSVSPPIYHRPQQSYPTEVRQLSKQNSANYVRKLRPPNQNWLPYQSEQEQGQSGGAKVVRYNVRKPSKYAAKYPKYPQYLPTTVLRLKSVKPGNYPPAGGNYQSGNYQSGGNYPSSGSNYPSSGGYPPANYPPAGGKKVYSVPMKANYAIKNIYSQPVIYEQLDYQTSSYPPGYAPNYSPSPNYSPAPNYPSPSNYQPAPNYPQVPNYPAKSPPPQQQAAYQPAPPPSKQYPPKPVKSKKTTVAAYIPVLQVPAIEHKPKMEAPVLNIKKPLGGYEEKIVEEHIYQIPNHMLHEVRHEVHGPAKPLNGLYLIAQPAPVYQPTYRPRPISQAVSHMYQSFGPHYGQHGEPHGLPHGLTELPKPQISYDTNYKQADGPPVMEMPYQMDNYAKAEDAGLFKPLLDRTRQANRFPKIGVVPYKNNDPENLNVIHLIANQKHLPLVVPITSIHVSSDGSYPMGPNEMPIMEKQIPSYSERPISHQKPPAPYGPAGGADNYPKIEQEKSGYVEDEKMILQQLNAKQPAEPYGDAYKEPQYVIHQEYSPPDLPPPDTSQYPVVNDSPQVIEQMKVGEEYPAPEVQQDVKGGNEYTLQQEVKGAAYPIEQVKEPALPQIQQITTEYVKQDYAKPEEPKTEQKTDTYQPPTQSYVQQIETPAQEKDTYTTQMKEIEEYGRRVPATNYQYVKPSNLPAPSYEQSSGYPSQSSYPIQSSYPSQSSYPAQSSYPQADSQSNDQSYAQPVESQKSVQQDSKEQLSEEQANIAAYEEARKSILQGSYQTSYQQPSSYQQPIVYQQPSSYQEQVSYQPPLSTAYDTKSEKANDYTDDYRTEPKSEVKTADRVYDLPSNTAEKVVSVPNRLSDGQYQSEILTSEEQTKKSYETLPEQKAVVSVVSSVSSSADEKQLLDAKFDSGQKYGERLVYVKSPKFKNLRTVNGNTYLGDTLLYSASTRSNSTLRRQRQQDEPNSRRSNRIHAEVLAISSTRSTSTRSASTRSPPTRSTTAQESSSSTEGEQLAKSELVTIGSDTDKPADQTESTKSDTVVSNAATTGNATEPTKVDDEQVVNYVKPVSRAVLRSLRIRKLKKDEDSKDGKVSSTAELISSASEQFESKLEPDAVVDLTNLDADELAHDLKADEADDLEASGTENSQLYHAYYGPPNHQPEPGYVRLTVQQFKEIFKDAEIHVLKSDQNTQLSSSSTSAPSVNGAELVSSSSTTPQV